MNSLFHLLERLTNWIDLHWDLFKRNHITNQSVEIGIEGYHHITIDLPHQLLQKQSLHLPGSRVDQQAYYFTESFDPFHRALVKKPADFIKNNIVILNFHNSIASSGIYVLKIYDKKTKVLLFRAGVAGLCTRSWLENHLKTNGSDFTN